MHEVLVNRLGGLSLPRKSVVRLTDQPDMTLDVYRGRKTTMQQQQQLFVHKSLKFGSLATSGAQLLSHETPDVAFRSATQRHHGTNYCCSCCVVLRPR